MVLPILIWKHLYQNFSGYGGGESGSQVVLVTAYSA